MIMFASNLLTFGCLRSLSLYLAVTLTVVIHPNVDAAVRVQLYDPGRDTAAKEIGTNYSNAKVLQLIPTEDANLDHLLNEQIKAVTEFHMATRNKTIFDIFRFEKSFQKGVIEPAEKRLKALIDKSPTEVVKSSSEATAPALTKKPITVHSRYVSKLEESLGKISEGSLAVAREVYGNLQGELSKMNPPIKLPKIEAGKDLADLPAAERTQMGPIKESLWCKIRENHRAFRKAEKELEGIKGALMIARKGWKSAEKDLAKNQAKAKHMANAVKRDIDRLLGDVSKVLIFDSQNSYAGKTIELRIEGLEVGTGTISKNQRAAIEVADSFFKLGKPFEFYLKEKEKSGKTIYFKAAGLNEEFEPVKIKGNPVKQRTPVKLFSGNKLLKATKYGNNGVTIQVDSAAVRKGNLKLFQYLETSPEAVTLNLTDSVDFVSGPGIKSPSSRERRAQTINDFMTIAGAIGTTIDSLDTLGSEFGQYEKLHLRIDAVDSVIQAFSTGEVDEERLGDDKGFQRAAAVAANLSSVATRIADWEPPELARFIIERQVLEAQQNAVGKQIAREIEEVALKKRNYEALGMEANFLTQVLANRDAIEKEYERIEENRERAFQEAAGLAVNELSGKLSGDELAVWRKRINRIQLSESDQAIFDALANSKLKLSPKEQRDVTKVMDRLSLSATDQARLDKLKAKQNPTPDEKGELAKLRELAAERAESVAVISPRLQELKSEINSANAHLKQRELLLIIPAEQALSETSVKPVKRHLYQAFIAYANALGLSKAQQEEVRVRLTDLERRKSLDRSELALNMWNSLIADPIVQLTAYYGNGVRAEELAEIAANVIGLGAIAWGVQQ